MNQLKQLLPFVFPATAIILVVILAVRWYGLRSDQLGKISEFAEGVEIEDLTSIERNTVLNGVKDVQTLDLEGEDETTLGEVRYEFAENKVKFSVTASLPKTDTAQYQVWLKEVGGRAVRKAFTLEMSKGGYTGSAAISDETLPFEVVVSKEMVDDDLMEQVLLRGVLEKTE
ncbi:hypothetical protein KJ707_01145 [Patescibacteria group bacterium]|nr:hypothetical protein [Patescibacteria group bacterium]MBU1967214.1 hypothetical protein [Patescibacteria group bacterium]MBU2543160.1 hypothetical protein [Patescibacteria group bacterium]